MKKLFHIIKDSEHEFIVGIILCVLMTLIVAWLFYLGPCSLINLIQ